MEQNITLPSMCLPSLGHRGSQVLADLALSFKSSSTPKTARNSGQKPEDVAR